MLYRSTDRLVCLSCPPKRDRRDQGWGPARVRLGLESPRQSLVRSPPPQSHTRTAARARARICRVGLWTNNAPSSSASTYLKIASTFISDRQARHSVFHERARGWTTWSSASRDCPWPLLYWRRLAASKPLLRRPWPALDCRSVSLTRARPETSPARWAAWPRPTRSTRRESPFSPSARVHEHGLFGNLRGPPSPNSSVGGARSSR